MSLGTVCLFWRCGAPPWCMGRGHAVWYGEVQAQLLHSSTHRIYMYVRYNTTYLRTSHYSMINK